MFVFISNYMTEFIKLLTKEKNLLVMPEFLFRKMPVVRMPVVRITVYVSLKGGFEGVIVTDVFQAIIMMGGLMAVLVAVRIYLTLSSIIGTP